MNPGPTAVNVDTGVVETLGEHDPRVARSRAKLLAAATELLVEAGARGVTVDAVAERSGVAKSTLYRHWGSVTELLIDVMRSNVPDPTPAELVGDFETELRGWVHRAVASLLRPDWARIIPALIELRRHSAEMADVFECDWADKVAAMESMLDLGVAEGRLPKGLDARHVTTMLAGPLVLATLSGREEQLPSLAEFVLERFLASYPAPNTDPRGRLGSRR